MSLWKCACAIGLEVSGIFVKGRTSLGLSTGEGGEMEKGASESKPSPIHSSLTTHALALFRSHPIDSGSLQLTELAHVN